MTHPSRPAPLFDRRESTALREELAATARAHPEWPDVWNLRGLLEAHDGDLRAARAAFEEALARHRSYGDAQVNLAWIDALAGRPVRAGASRAVDEAAATWLGFVRNVVAGVDAGLEGGRAFPGLDFLALLHAAAGADSTRIATLRERLERSLPGADRLLSAAGFLEAGHLATHTMRPFSHPERYNPGFAPLLLRAARNEGASGRTDAARRLHALAALYRGRLALFLVTEGEAASRRQDPDRSLELLREAVAASPDWHRAHQALGYELSVRGIVGEALHHLAEATRLAPRFPDVLYQYGLLLHAAGMNGEAMDVMGRALSANPRYHVARIALANLLFEADRAAEAAPHYEHVLDSGIETPLLAGQFGYSLHRAGDRNRAEELFLEAIARHRSRPELLAYYGRFLAETNRQLEANTVWERALASGPTPRLREEIEGMMAGTGTDPQGEEHDG